MNSQEIIEFLISDIPKMEECYRLQVLEAMTKEVLQEILHSEMTKATTKRCIAAIMKVCSDGWLNER